MTHYPDIQSGDTGVSNDELQDIQSGVTGASNDELQGVRDDSWGEPVDHGTLAVLGAPMLELFSISIKPKANSIDDDISKPWAIYGTVVAVHSSAATVDIYSRSPDNPEKISEIDPDGIFYLTLPNYGPISGLFPSFCVKVELMDKVRNCILIQKSFELNYKEYKYDIVQYENVEDDNATLCVKHVTYRAAVTATVEVVLRKKVEEDCNKNSPDFYVEAKNEQSLDGTDVVGVAGTLTGSHHYTRSDFSEHSHGGSDSCSCINLVTFLKDSSKVTLGTSVPLSRAMLAVPAYSLFLIDIDLMVSEYGHVRNVAEFCVCEYGTLVKNVEVPGELICQLKVSWSHVLCEIMYRMEKEEATSHESESSNTEKKMKVDDPNANSSTFTLYNDPLPLDFKGEKLMEIFSISLGLKKDEFCNVYGRIEVSDVLDELIVYDKDESCPEKIACGGTLSLQGPDNHCLASSNYVLKVDLKVNHQQFCRGYFCWSGPTLRRPWLDEYLCSVIKGEFGYVAIHYVIFPSAVQAKVKIFFISSSDRAIVTGKVAAEYSGNDYDIDFDREYYRTVIFSTTQGSPAMLVSGDEQPIPLSSGRSSDDRKVETRELFKESGIPLLLSRSLVCVPTDASLFVDVKLVATVETQESKSEDVGFSGRAEFVIGREMCCVIESEGHQLCILVDWGTVMRAPWPKK